MLRIASCCLFALSLACLAACGGGGGGDETPPEAPGTLRAVALEGQMAPGTAGVFTAFPDYPLMDAADGGFCAFVAPTSDAAKPEVLYAVLADAAATLVPVFAIDEALPAPSDGAIDAFLGVWVADDGVIVAFVQVTGDSSLRTFGLISARVSGGVATEKQAVIYSGADLTGAGGSSTLTSLDAETLRVARDGTVWFLGEDGPAVPFTLFSVERDASNLTRRAWVGFGLSGGASLTSVDAFEIDDIGSIFVVAGGRSTGGDVLVARTSVGLSLNQEIFATGYPLPSGGVVTQPFKGGRIIVYDTARFIWVAQGNGGGVDDVCMLYDALLSTVDPLDRYFELARSGDTAPGTGMGVVGSIDLLNVGPSVDFPAFRASVSGSTNGVTSGTFGVVAVTGSNLVLDSANLAVVGSSVVPASWVDLARATPPDDEVAIDGSCAFVQAFSGTSALYWVIRFVGTFPIAAEGGPAPGGDTFGSFAVSAAHTVAEENLLFRANLVTAGSGILRRGP